MISRVGRPTAGRRPANSVRAAASEPSSSGRFGSADTIHSRLMSLNEMLPAAMVCGSSGSTVAACTSVTSWWTAAQATVPMATAKTTTTTASSIATRR